MPHRRLSHLEYRSPHKRFSALHWFDFHVMISVLFGLSRCAGCTCCVHLALMRFVNCVDVFTVRVFVLEDNQKDLENATEQLSEYLERDISSDILQDVKQKVQDKYR